MIVIVIVIMLFIAKRNGRRSKIRRLKTAVILFSITSLIEIRMKRSVITTNRNETDQHRQFFLERINKAKPVSVATSCNGVRLDPPGSLGTFQEVLEDEAASENVSLPSTSAFPRVRARLLTENLFALTEERFPLPGKLLQGSSTL